MTERHEEVHEEKEVLPRRLILGVIVGTIVVGAALCWITWEFMRARQAAFRPSLRFPERELPAPRETANVRQELFRVARPEPGLKEQQAARLRSFGWVNRERGLIHIPIDSAMEIVARRYPSPPGRAP